MRIIEKYEQFISKQEYNDFQQSIQWAKLKKYWENEIIIIYDENKNIIATMSILIRKVPVFGNIMYVPRGPIGDIHDENILKEITERTKKIAKKYKAFVIIIEPNIQNDDEKFKKVITKLGYQINNKAMKFDQEIQARHNFRLNIENKTEEEVFQSFSSKTRYNIRVAIKKGVTVVEKNLEGLEEFYRLMEQTGKRDDFRIRPKEYFEDILKKFPNQAKIFIAYHAEKPIAAIMPIRYGNKMWYLYGASGNENRNCMPNYLLQWEMIKMAIKNNCKLYDFRGVSMDQGEQGGIFRFKKGFGGDFVELIGEIYMPFSRIKYVGYKIGKRVFCAARHFTYKHMHKDRVFEKVLERKRKKE